MYLIIADNLEASFLVSMISDDGVVISVSSDKNIGFAEQLLNKIYELLQLSQVELADIKVLAVLKSQINTFNSIRTAVATANVFGYCLNRPVILLNSELSNQDLLFACRQNINHKFTALFPQYNRLPNITFVTTS
jgi:hypothetical protein